MSSCSIERASLAGDVVTGRFDGPALPTNGINESRAASLGEVWFNLVRLTAQTGVSDNSDCLEIFATKTAFSAETEGDALIQRFGNRQMIADMEKVFFTENTNSTGHSYANLMRGPDGRHDLADVIALLRAEPGSKRAVVTLCGTGHGKVPCVNVIQFLIRAGALRTIYFARGQDAFKKFYADALCLAKMTRGVAKSLELPADVVTGFIGSSHVYHEDKPAIDDFLMQGELFFSHGEPKGVR